MNHNHSVELYWISTSEFWQWGGCRRSLSEKRPGAAPCWTQTVPFSSNRPPGGYSWPISQDGGASVQTYLRNGKNGRREQKSEKQQKKHQTQRSCCSLENQAPPELDHSSPLAHATACLTEGTAYTLWPQQGAINWQKVSFPQVETALPMTISDIFLSLSWHMSFLAPVLSIFSLILLAGRNKQAAGWVFGCHLKPTHHRNMDNFHLVEMFLDKYENCHRRRNCTPRFQSQITHWTSYASPSLKRKHRHMDSFTWQQNSLRDHTTLPAAQFFCQHCRKFSLVCLTPEILDFF